MARGESVRAIRVAELVRAEVARALTTSFSDPRLQTVMVSRVELTADLQLARVFVRTAGEDTEETRKQVMKGLRAAATRLRRMVAAAVALRRAPELKFEFDTGPDARGQIDALLKEIKSERG